MTTQEQMQSGTAIGDGFTDRELGADEVRATVARLFAQNDVRGQRVLLIVPDNTRTAPVGLLFQTIFDEIGDRTAALDVIIALGTHPPLTQQAINHRLEITPSERAGKYKNVQVHNHAWDNPDQLAHIGTIPSGEIAALSNDLFAMDVPVWINKIVFDYDLLVIVGPVFPHEVVGFSGGNKYLFPGIGGPQILNFFHWLGAVISNPRIIGNKWTPVRAVVDRAAQMVPTRRLACCMVVKGSNLAGLYAGGPEAAWSAAADLSGQLHVIYKEKPFHTVLSCLPPMYDELWVGGKGMYKLEPVVADGGELIIYAPHLREISITHGETIRRVGYHVRDYFLKQWERFENEPWGTIAHSSHVRGIGSYENGVERPRITVTLATGIDEKTCREIGLNYRDPLSILPGNFVDREDEGILYIAKAGEMLYRLNDPPAWARP